MFTENLKIKVRERQVLKAMTLVELILYMALFSSVILIIMSFMTVIAKTRARGETVATVDRDTARMMQNITQTVRNSSAINTPVQGASGASLSVNVDTPALSPTVYSINSGRLQVVEGANPAVFLSSNNTTITALTFRNLSSSGTNEIVRVEMTISYKNPDNNTVNDYTQTYYTSIALK